MTDNELIAQFMGHKPGTATNHPLDFNYHESYDCLMPVVAKIDSLGMYDSIVFRELNEHTICAKIDHIYSAVVEFIKWYNENGKEKT